MDELTKQYFDLYTRTFRKGSRTAYQYEGEIKRLETFTGKDFRETVREDVTLYREHLRLSHAPSTVSKILHVLSAFGEFLEENGAFLNCFRYSFGEDVTYRELTKPLPSARDMDAFFLKLDMQYPSVGMVARIVYHTGCGLEELLQVKPEDVVYTEQPERYCLLFHNYAPFQLMRQVTLPDAVTPFFSRHLKYLDAIHTPYLFVNRYGNKLTTTNIQIFLRQSGCGYTIRDLKTMAQIRFANSGATADEIAEYTGHTKRWLYRYRKVSSLPPALDEINYKDGE